MVAVTSVQVTDMLSPDLRIVLFQQDVATAYTVKSFVVQEMFQPCDVSRRKHSLAITIYRPVFADQHYHM